MPTKYDAHNAYIAFYTSRTGVFVSTYLPLLVVLGAIPVILLRADVREFLHPENSQGYFVLIVIFGGFLVVAAVESILALIHTGAGKPALVIDANGVCGRHAYLNRSFSWDEIDEIFTKTGKLYVTRKPTNILERLTQKYTRPGGRGRFETFMLIPLANIDKPIADINFAIQNYAPVGSRFADGTWSIPKEPLFHAGRLQPDTNSGRGP